ncbi:outer membrane beta-barrel protein [Oryzomonas rubra]|uniref:Porin family protein n=1 Tax=Oryzomonas rubra TaxID=2509454 RepID=A0A5A9XD46_9BACT|nr:outer membrane beta-barrel protein [Oryzomonas rubra]KAA0890463.1 porin family protein [Oryzomonas rubra]
MHKVFNAIAVSVLVLFASTAMADTIANRLGFTGKVGFATPVKDDFINGTSETKTGFAGGGGLLYGFGDYVAAELDVTHLPKLDVKNGGSKAYEATLTDIGLGLQCRFIPNGKVVPYIGAGADFIKGSLKHVSGNDYDLDWTYGGHVSAGVDWFLTKGIALTAEARAVRTISGDILSGSTKVGEYDPYWVQGTFGLRMFLPETFWR